MNEKIYKTMGRVGGGNIAMGAVLVVAGGMRRRGIPAFLIPRRKGKQR